MKALRSLVVRGLLPESLRALEVVAMNLRWSWHAPARELLRRVDPEAWERTGQDPARVLGLVTRDRLERLSSDPGFRRELEAVAGDLERYTNEPRWHQDRGARSLEMVAYFSPEFGVSEVLPTYSGGLGVLAGDHLKGASDLGVPIAGVGLLYRQGYFRQQLTPDGWQQEDYPALDPHGLPLSLVTGPGDEPLEIELDLAGARCLAQVWRAQVGRAPLYLLDCDVEGNDREERGVTDRLYAGSSEHRLRQEMVLGIGGIRALEAMGYAPNVFHSNEGHAGFLGLERIRRFLRDEKLAFDEALEAVRAACVFTTHTPVPAGIDVYDFDLMKRYFDSFAAECGVSFEELMNLGRADRADAEPASFNMAVMGMRLAGSTNAVSKLHRTVSQTLFSELWPRIPSKEAPIGSVTNGVHAATWLGRDMSDVVAGVLGPGWNDAGGARKQAALQVTDEDLWRARARLVDFVRRRLRGHVTALGASESKASWADEVLDPHVLTVGFARRFAQYKRATLMLSDPDRLRRLLTSRDRPVQIVVAGKAHPRDDGGKEMIRALAHFASEPEVRHRFVFVEDYDMELARVLTQGADVWLNTPRRPLEACGTSGMKAALNGALNCSVLDGWWDECYDGSNGWAIGTRHAAGDEEAQERSDAEALFDLLEREIGPRFYDRDESLLPRRWLVTVRQSIATLAPFVTADRMIREYVRELYEPAAELGHRLTADGFSGARELASWKSRVRAEWEQIEIVELENDSTTAGLEAERSVSAGVRLGRLTPGDVCVELEHGAVGEDGELVDPRRTELAPGETRDGVCGFTGSFIPAGAGPYGLCLRVLPAHPELPSRADLGLVETLTSPPPTFPPPA